MNEDNQIDLKITNNNKNSPQRPKKKRKLSQLEKDVIKLNFLSNLKIKKKYNCTKKSYDHFVVNCLLNNANCHLVSLFKEKMLTDYIDEFLRREYRIKECNERIPKFSVYYQNYLFFFCMPTFSNLAINEIINDYGERKAEVYYKNNYQGGKSIDNEDIAFEQSDSEEENDRNTFKFNENGEIFDNSLKENIDNVTIMIIGDSTSGATPGSFISGIMPGDVLETCTGKTYTITIAK